ncbi:hypothetical protein FHS72_002736 [Loktanella ponticola]|uniref:Porin family protein n=1 Tax=Yoonia ponticola TaxID=1524255 RepID=A0A7W9EYW1_9RHOB|nr:hypothetical protein [Yoonia ponticola]MBB5723099.1 hypothetical protein [Yoonia ponticola]
MKLTATLTALAMTFAAPVVAQDLYIGGGLDYGYPHSGDSETFGSFIAGVIFDVGPIGVGIEGDIGVQLSEGDDRETSRVRGLVTYDFGQITGIASVGGVQYKRGSTVYDGETYGLGAQMPVTSMLDGRLEFMRDFVGGDFETNVTTTRLSVLYKF